MDVHNKFQRIKISGVLHVFLGSFIISVGIADRVEMTEHLSSFPAKFVLAIWMGCWMLFTGVIGICISLHSHTYDVNALNKPKVIIYQVFTVIAIGFAVSLITCYSVSLAMIAANEGSCAKCPISKLSTEILTEMSCNARVILAVLTMFLSVLEFLASIWTLFCCIPPTASSTTQEKVSKSSNQDADRQKTKTLEGSKWHLPSRIRFGQPENPKKLNQPAPTLLELSVKTSDTDQNV